MSLVAMQSRTEVLQCRRLHKGLIRMGVRRVVLVGPNLKDDQYLQTVEVGFDEVWLANLSAPTLPVLFYGARQAAMQVPHADVERLRTLGDMAFAQGSFSSWEVDRKVYLGAAGFARLQRLVLNTLGVASCGKLSMASHVDALGVDVASRAPDVSVFWLRRKLQEAGVELIKSVSGFGYQVSMTYAGSTDSGYADLRFRAVRMAVRSKA